MNASEDQAGAFILGMLVGVLVGAVGMGLVSTIVTGLILRQKRDRK